MTTTTFGSFPGVRAIITPGGIAGVQVGRQQKTVLFGYAEEDGSAPVEEPTQITTRVGARSEFGASSELALSIEDALNNGANIDFLYGIAVNQNEVAGDDGSGSDGDATKIADGSGTLSNVPIVENKLKITVHDDTNQSEPDVVFRYESPPDPSDLSDGEVAINPNTGEFESGDSNSYAVDYYYGDWQAALDAADQVVNHNETGIYAPLSDSEEVAQMLSNKVDELRPNWQLVKGVMGAQPNATAESGEGILDISTYGDSIDNDAVFLAGPTRIAGQTDRYRSVVGGLAGLFAGHTLINPVYGDPVQGYDSLAQSLNRSEQNSMRSDGIRVIPLEDDRRGRGGIRIADNLSTSSATGWTRDFHRLRIVDQVMMIGKEIGDQARDNLMSDTLLTSVREDFESALEDLVNVGLLESSRSGTLTNNNLSRYDDDQNPSTTDDGRSSGGQNEDQETRYFVDVTRSATDTISISVGFRPVGIARNIDETIIVSEN